MRRARTRGNPLELGEHRGPDDADELGAGGGELLLARQAGTLPFRLSGNPAAPPRQRLALGEALLMALVGRRLLLF